jgi:predicted PurR-regulated permease PerM
LPIFHSFCNQYFKPTKILSLKKDNQMHKEPSDPEISKNEVDNPALQTSAQRYTAIFTAISVIILAIVLRSILTSFVFACILAALTWPIRTKVMKMTRNRPNLTAGLLIIGMISLVCVPLAGILTLAVSQAQDLFLKFNTQHIRTWILFQGDQLDKLPLASQLGLTTEKLLLKLQDGMSDIATWGMNAAFGVGSDILHTIMLLGITLMSLYYLYVSGDSLLLHAKKLVPMPESQVDDLLEAFRRTSKATFKGNFVIGAIQGALTGLLFWGTGLPSPAFFGLVAAFASLIPAVGSGLVWGPAALLLAMTGDFTHALVVGGVGIGIISTIDNVLRPALVGRDAGMHDLMVFLTTIGGISFFGPIGVLFGPLVGAVVLALLRLYEGARSGGDSASIEP